MRRGRERDKLKENIFKSVNSANGETKCYQNRTKVLLENMLLDQMFSDQKSFRPHSFNLFFRLLLHFLFFPSSSQVILFPSSSCTDELTYWPKR